MKLDEKDTAILNALIKNGRASLRELARAVGISAPAVNARLKRLSAAGIIKGYAAVVDRGLVSSGMEAIALLRVSPQELKDVERALTMAEEVYAVYETAGHYNLAVFIEVKGPEAMGRALERVETMSGVEDVETLMLRLRVKENAQRQLSRPSVNLRCEYCGNAIAGRPYTLEYKGVTMFFCCPTCRKEFREKYMS